MTRPADILIILFFLHLNIFVVGDEHATGFVWAAVKVADRGTVTRHLAPTESPSLMRANNSTALTAAGVMCTDVIRLPAACGGWCYTAEPFGILAAPPDADLWGGLSLTCPLSLKKIKIIPGNTWAVWFLLQTVRFVVCEMVEGKNTSKKTQRFTLRHLKLNGFIDKRLKS